MIVAKETVSDLLYYDKKPVLELYIEYPQIDGPYTKLSEEKFNTFYIRKARAENRRARSFYYQQAVKNYNFSKKENFPFMVNSYRSTFSSEYISKDYVSLLFDIYTFTGGAHGMTVRSSDTWDMKKGRRVSLTEICPNCTDKNVTDIIVKQIAADSSDGYFDDAAALAVKYYDPENFYIKDGEIYIYYQLYTIAPYSSGFKTFKISQ